METAEAATTDNAALDVVFVGDNYAAADLPKFDQDVDRVVAHLLTYEPFASRASQFAFHSVENAAVDLGCVRHARSSRLLTCRLSTVISVVNDAGAPYDRIIVLVNDSRYGGSGGPLTVSYNGGQAPQVVVHEFGHSFGLLDEYTLSAATGVLDGRTRANCYAGHPTNPLWEGVVDTAAYALGCQFPNWYRSSACSIMRSLGCRSFNAVSTQVIHAKMDVYAGVSLPPPPVPPPTVSLTANPALIGPQGSSLLSWSAEPVTGCQAAGGWQGGKPAAGADTQRPSATTTYTLTCANAAGSATQSVTVTVDSQAPRVSLTAPAHGTTVSGAVTIEATLTDDQGEGRADFYHDGLLLGADNTPPYQLGWAASQEAEGVHTLTVKATDAAGNTAESSPVLVTVVHAISPPWPTPPDEPVILTPADGSEVSGRVRVLVTAGGHPLVSRLRVYLDGVVKRSSWRGQVWFTWNAGASHVSPGRHVITATTFDTARHQLASTSITVYKPPSPSSN